MKEACDIVAPIFGSDHIDWDRLEQWRMRNPQAFMEILNQDGQLAGCFVIIGLDNSFMEEFIVGNTEEKQILGENVLTMKETKKLSQIYISGVMVSDTPSFLSAKRTMVMIWCILRYLKHFFGASKKRTVFAVALNKESERLLLSMQFQVHTSAANRVDRHDLYSIEFSDETLEQSYQRIGEFSRMCKIRFNVSK